MFRYVLIPYVQAAVDMTAFGNAVNPIIQFVVYPVISLMFAVAVVMFAYGVLQLVYKGEDGESRSSAKKSILFGSIGMFIMVSAWGIVYLVSNTVKQVNTAPATQTITPSNP